MISYTLSKISTIVGGEIIGNPSISVGGFIFDSRKTLYDNNGLFLAVNGERHDGHAYIAGLYAKGIRGFLVTHLNDEHRKLEGAGFIKVGNTIRALQKLVAYHRKQFSLPVVAITGSNGKTIIKEWLAGSLAIKKQVVRSPKSYNSQIGVPLSVWLLNNNADWGIFEAGISQPGEMKYLEQVIQPTQGIFTNIGAAHQQGFSSIKEKVREKLKLFQNCETIFYCADHVEVNEELLADKVFENKNLIRWSLLEADANFFFKPKSGGKVTTSFELNYNNELHSLKLPFSDKASIENALHVVVFLMHNGYSFGDVQQSISKLQPIAMRLELIKGINNCTLINDTYNSDINSLSIALDYLNQQPEGEQTLILSEIQQSGLSNQQLYSKVADLMRQSNIKYFVGIGKNIKEAAVLFEDFSVEFYETTEGFIADAKWRNFSNRSILIKGARGYSFEQIVSILSEKNHTTVLKTNLNNLVDNLNYFRGLLKPSTKIMVMVKALAYGSGTHEIASILQHEKVDYLGVAFADEGVLLRQAGIALPIMVMAPGQEDYNRIIEYELEPEIYSLSALKNFITATKGLQVNTYPIHIKIDTGMHRLGFQLNELDDLLHILKSTDVVSVKSIFSHLAASDDAIHDKFTHAQINTYEKAFEKIYAALGYKPLRHILNSAGIERFPEAHFDMVRLGIGLHGISVKSKTLKPVSSLISHIAQIKKVSKDQTVGYGRRGKAPGDIKIATIPIGYADGLDRRLGNGVGYLLLNGIKCPYIGSICMDMCMVDVTEVDCSEGDEVTIFGEKPGIKELAQKINTIPYEVLTNVAGRVKRVYSKD